MPLTCYASRGEVLRLPFFAIFTKKRINHTTHIDYFAFCQYDAVARNILQ